MSIPGTASMIEGAQEHTYTGLLELFPTGLKMLRFQVINPGIFTESSGGVMG